MRVLLDENLPRKLKGSLEGAIMTVPERGWSGIKNGRLLRLAAAEFDVLVTMDRGMEYQQNLSGIDLGLIVLTTVSNDIDDLLPLVPQINAALGEVAAGRVLHVAV
jgi:predicted nuclease of predicted toxin-antitoxin system